MHAIGWKSDQSHRVENTLFNTESLKYWCNNSNSIMLLSVLFYGYIG